MASDRLIPVLLDEIDRLKEVNGNGNGQNKIEGAPIRENNLFLTNRPCYD